MSEKYYDKEKYRPKAHYIRNDGTQTKIKTIRLTQEELSNWDPKSVHLFLKGDELKDLSREHKWRIEVLKRDNFTCIVCGKPCNSAHHIYSRRYCQENKPELEWDVKNGVAACFECHGEISKDGRKWFK